MGRAVHIRGLSLTAGDQLLLEDADLTVQEGELCLLVGASGTGKSLTLRLISGLPRAGRAVVATAEEAQVLGADPIASHSRGAGIPGTSIVFQHFALMDDVDAEGNVLFGIDHRAGRPGKSADRRAEARALLDELRLPRKRRPAVLSGGMKQRLAIARALAFQPQLLLYDEPTSGLDPATSLRVARLIRDEHERHQCTTIVVTHDLEAIAGIADRIVLLDPEHRKFREVPKEGVQDAMHALAGFAPEEKEPTPVPLSRRLLSPFDALGGFVLALASVLFHLLPTFVIDRRLSARWAGHFFLHYLRLGTIGSAIPFLMAAGVVCGFVTTFFMYSLLPYQGYTEPVLSEEFVGSLGFALFRVVVPGITALLFAVRTGAATAADIGNRVLTGQIDALRTHGVSPPRYLLFGLTWSSLLGIPLLAWLAWEAARFSALGVFLATHPGHGTYAFNTYFMDLVTHEGLQKPLLWVVSKLLVCAVGASTIAYHVGLQDKRSGAEVATGVTRTIIITSLFVLAVHMVYAFFEY